MSQLTDYLSSNWQTHQGMQTAKRVTCQDGFSLSVQAGAFLYCAPRETLSYRAYTLMEVGYPSQEEELLTPYAEDKDDLTETVYPYVPIEVIEQVVAKHGGIQL